MSNNYYHKGSKTLIPGLGSSPELDNFSSQVPVQVVTDDVVLTAGDTGSVILVNHAAKTVTLPPAQDGMRFEIIWGIETTAGANILTYDNTECFFGYITLGSDTTDQYGVPQNITYAVATGTPASHDAMKFVAATATIGGVSGTKVVCTAVDGVAWHVDISNHSTSANDPGTVALIVAR